MEADDSETDAADTPQSSWRTLIRHPLFLTIVAFCLTTFIGGVYDHILNQRDVARTEARQALDGMREFSTLVFGRQTRSDLVRSAVSRGDGVDARARKAAYDEIYVRWNNTLPLNLSDLRAYVGPRDNSKIYEKAVNQSIRVAFRETDVCLTHAYDVARRAGFPYPAPEVPMQARPGGPDGKLTQPCGGEHWYTYLKTRHNRVRACMNTVLNNSVPQIQRLIAGKDLILTDQILDEIHTQVAGDCPGMDPHRNPAGAG